MYKRKPVGDYHVGVCTNTLCAVMGGDVIFERLKDHLDVGNDETTADGKVTLEHVECNAACDYAPVMMVNWEFLDNMTPASAVAARRRPARGQGGHAPPAAPRICTWKRGRAGARRLPRRPGRRGPGRRPASLVGLALARESGWTGAAKRGQHGRDQRPAAGRHSETETAGRGKKDG